MGQRVLERGEQPVANRLGNAKFFKTLKNISLGTGDQYDASFFQVFQNHAFDCQ